MRVPTPISMWPGVRISKCSHGGVTVPRFFASAKKGKISAGDRASQSSELNKCSFIFISWSLLRRFRARPVEYLGRKQRNLPLNVNTDGTLDWDHRICDLIEQNRDVLKYFFCATFPARGAYRLVAGEKPLFKAGFPEI